MSNESAPSVGEANGAVVTADFVRHRNVMLLQAEMSPLFVDYYLHLADNGIRHTPEQDTLLKQALTAFTLHAAARPRNEHLSWTIGLQEPRLNLFMAGDNEDCTVTGRLFTENVREAPRNLFFGELMPGRGREKRRSVVEFDGADLFKATETYYATSEQRPARFFDLGDEKYAMLMSHPDVDEAWLRSVQLDELKDLKRTQTLARIERRLYRWHCGCEQRKILAALAPVAQQGLGELFGDGEVIHVQCPRCAANYTITREAMEAFLASAAKPK